MKKTILFALLSLILSSTAFAEELVVHLTSGNAVVIQYTGTIQGVTFQGKTDAIAGLDLPTAAKPAARIEQPATSAQQPVVEKQTANPQPEQVEAKNGKERWFRFKWAEPKSED